MPIFKHFAQTWIHLGWAKPFKQLISISMIGLYLSSCANIATDAPKSSMRSDALSRPLYHPSALEQFDQTLKQLAAKDNICNPAIAVIKNRKIVSVSSVTGCATASAQNSESVFQAASLSKPVFAYAVMSLVAQGKLNLDTPIMQYLPQGYRHRDNPLQAQPSSLVTDPRLQQVTVRMALNHSAGLPNWASGRLSFNAMPGEKWQYSGEGYVLLQRAVEAVTGLPLDQVMQQQVFSPLGMTHSSYVWNTQVATHLLSGMKANAHPRVGIALTEPVSAFSLYTTATDYARFVQALLHQEKLLQHIVASPVVVDPQLNLSWGLGWGIESTTTQHYIWHWGNNPGYRAFVMASVETGDGFVYLTNSDNGLRLAKPLADMLLPDQHKVFEFSMLKDDVMNKLCNTLRICF